MIRFAMAAALLMMFLGHTAVSQNVYGEMRLVNADGYLLAATAMPGGEKAWFAVDLAMHTTTITKAYAGTSAIEELHGSRDPLLRKGFHSALGGFGFNTEIVGTTKLERLNVGGLQFPNAEVMVMDRMPEINGYEIAGILGVDMLRRAEIALFIYGDEPRLMLKSAERPSANDAVEVPMKIVDNYLFVDGSLNGQSVSFLIDTGSPHSYLPVKTLRATGAAAVPSSSRTVMLIDGSEAKVREARVESFAIGSVAFTDMPFHIGELPVFGRLPADMVPVLLGNAFLGSMKSVQFNFPEQTVRLTVQ